MTKTILFLPANPSDSARPALEQEANLIKEEIDRSNEGAQYVFQSALDMGTADWCQTVLDVRPSIIHFAGHEDGIYGVIGDADTPEAHLMPAELLKRLFTVFSDVECVVLNACFREEQAQAIAQLSPTVIGMPADVSDVACREFALYFYRTLGEGKLIDFAYERGAVSLFILGVPEVLAPKMLSARMGARNPSVSPLGSVGAFFETIFDPVGQVLDPVKHALAPVGRAISRLVAWLLQFYGIKLDNTQSRIWWQWGASKSCQ